VQLQRKQMLQLTRQLRLWSVSVAEVKTSVTTANDNVKLLAAQVTTLQAAVATLIDSFGDQLTQIIEMQTTLMAMLTKMQAQLNAQAKAAAKKK